MKLPSQSKKPKWDETIVPISKPKRCKHYFEWTKGECKCKNCGFGLMGVVDIKDGRPV